MTANRIIIDFTVDVSTTFWTFIIECYIDKCKTHRVEANMWNQNVNLRQSILNAE